MPRYTARLQRNNISLKISYTSNLDPKCRNIVKVCVVRIDLSIWIHQVWIDIQGEKEEENIPYTHTEVTFFWIIWQRRQGRQRRDLASGSRMYQRSADGERETYLQVVSSFRGEIHSFKCKINRFPDNISEINVALYMLHQHHYCC